MKVSMKMFSLSFTVLNSFSKVNRTVLVIHGSKQEDVDSVMLMLSCGECPLDNRRESAVKRMSRDALYSGTREYVNRGLTWNLERVAVWVTWIIESPRLRMCSSDCLNARVTAPFELVCALNIPPKSPFWPLYDATISTPFPNPVSCSCCFNREFLLAISKNVWVFSSLAGSPFLNLSFVSILKAHSDDWLLWSGRMTWKGSVKRTKSKMALDRRKASFRSTIPFTLKSILRICGGKTGEATLGLQF